MYEREKVLEHIRNPEAKAMLEERIAKYRKGDGVLTVTDENGRAISGASVKLTHKKHECKFGANLFMLDELETPEKNALYKKYFSEVFTMATLPFYWDSTEPENEQIQAELLEGLYTTWFAHPNVEQIIYWNLVDGYAYVPSDDPEVIGKSQGDMTVGENRFYGGLLRFDMSPKPAYYALKELLQKKWHTEFEGGTDLCGQLKFHGFWGEYDLEIVTPEGKTFYKTITHSSKTNNPITITL